MSDPISRDDAKRIIDNIDTFCAGWRDYAMEQIDDLTTIDPVKHGRWELAEDGWYCSACELYPPFDCDPEEKGIPFCPWCGAKMDEVGR